MCQYSESMGSSVQNLHVDLPSKFRSYSQVLSAVDFGRFTKVRSVHFEGRLGQRTESRLLEDVFRKVFSQIASPQFEKVSMSVTWVPADPCLSFFGIPDNIILESFDWGQLSDVLQQTIGDNLQELRLVIRNFPRYQHQQTEDFLKKRLFSAFHSRGIFRVDFTNL